MDNLKTSDSNACLYLLASPMQASLRSAYLHIDVLTAENNRTSGGTNDNAAPGETKHDTTRDHADRRVLCLPESFRRRLLPRWV